MSLYITGTIFIKGIFNMKIISTHENRFTCGQCETVAEYENSDIKYKSLPPGYDEYENIDVFYVCCPTCGSQIKIKCTPLQKKMAMSPKPEIEI